MLAVGQAMGVDGRRALGAFLVASEAASRIGAAANGGFHQRGFHPTGVVGAFGSALGAAYLYGLEGEQLLDAQGIVLSQASAVLSSSMMEPGRSAIIRPGECLWANRRNDGEARLFGPRKPYEGRYGLFNLYMRDPAMAEPRS